MMPSQTGWSGHPRVHFVSVIMVQFWVKGTGCTVRGRIRMGYVWLRT